MSLVYPFIVSSYFFPIWLKFETLIKYSFIISFLLFCRDDVISINELVLAMKRLQKVPDDTRLQKIAEVLDEDSDGQIQVSHVLRVCNLVAQH